jgi:pepF/M3 family oligoendopeptidase
MIQDPSLPPRWDVTNIYPSLTSDEFEADIELINTKTDALFAYLDEHQIEKRPTRPDETDPQEMAQILDYLVGELNSLYTLFGTLYAYINSFVSTDSYNVEAKRTLSVFQQKGVRLQQANTRIDGWIGGMGGLLEEAINIGDLTKTHAFALREIAQQSAYMMSQAEEDLAAELSLSGVNAWSKLQGTVTSQLNVDFELDGETKKMPAPALINLRTHPDEATRRRAYEAEMVAWESVKEPLAAALNGVKGAVNTLDQHRGRQDALHSAIDMARIDRATLETMLVAMQASFPTFRRYFKAKARRLGKESLAWWDLFAPMGKAGTRFSFAQAREIVLEQFGSFSPGLRDFAQHAFDSNWIDAEMRDGKRVGAFCMGLPKVKESRVFLNFDGSLDSIFTLAHELGHAFHNECARDKTPLQRQTPMTLAETASIMCETIVFEAAIKQAVSTEDELAILDTSLVSDSQVIVDIYSRYLFEKEVFERRAQAELSAEDFCEIMERAQAATYGDGLDERFRHKYMWTWKPHYYRPGLSFYNFPYAYGLLFGTGLYAIYQQRGDDFIPEYLDLLASTGEESAEDLAARFGIDLRSPEFWQNSLNVITRRVDRYEKLI